VRKHAQLLESGTKMNGVKLFIVCIHLYRRTAPPKQYLLRERKEEKKKCGYSRRRRVGVTVRNLRSRF